MDRKELKITTPAYNTYQPVLTLGDGLYGIRPVISREEKEDLALEMVSGGVVFEEKLGICFDAVNADVAHFFLRLKHYTDIDLEPHNSDEGQYLLYNACKACDAYTKVLDVTRDDWDEVMDIYYALHAVLTQSFEREHSLAYRLSSILGGFLTTEEMDRTLAEAQDINNVLVDALGALREQETVGEKIGGNIISLAKKDTGKLPN